MRRSQKTYHTEELLDNVYSFLLDDLSPDNHGFGFRKYSGPTYNYAGAYTFKRFYQMESFYKRIITSRDRSFESLAEEGFRDFVASQKMYWLPRPLTLRQERVLISARRICHSILGEFSLEEMAPLCTFGKKAARFLPFRESYLDKRMCTLNGSRTQFEWFKFCLSEDIHLNRAYRKHKNFCECDEVEIHAVPKSFKSCRIIAPDTTLGGFLSRGLGLLIRQRLESGTKIHLSLQQERHKVLAQKASINGKLATIDMSKASDSFTREHLYALLPESWHNVVDVVHTKLAKVPTSSASIPLRSYMLMGSGHTFPLQTLLFYCLCKAVLEELGSNSTVSVYGDDIILPTRHVVQVMTCLEDNGFKVNRDKSFWTGPFRESCGGDYHTGMDVRPFMLEHECCKASMHEYVALIHKVVNGLQARWDSTEIPSTLSYLLGRLLQVSGRINIVPTYEPDDCGIKNPPPQFVTLCSPIRYVNGIACYHKLVYKSKRRRPKSERIYYWYSLRPHQQTDVYDTEVLHGTLDESGREVMKGSHRYCWQCHS